MRAPPDPHAVPRALSAGALVIALLLPGGAARAAPGSPSARAIPASCAGYTIAVTPGNPVEGGGKLTLTRGGRTVHVIEEYQILGAECVDLTGDRTPELIVEMWTGVSCCPLTTVLTLRPAPRRILSYGGRKGQAVNLDGGAHEIVARLRTLAYFGGLPASDSPSLTVVYCYDGRRFVNCSRRFPGPLLDEIARLKQRLAQAARDRGQVEAQKAHALAILATSMLLGRDAEGWAAVRSLAPPAVVRWLAGHETALRRTLRTL